MSAIVDVTVSAWFIFPFRLLDVKSVRTPVVMTHSKGAEVPLHSRQDSYA